MQKNTTKRDDFMRKYLIGVIIGFTLSIGVSAHAEVVNLINQAVQGLFPVTIDGKPLGDAIVVDNKTYLPVREFGEAAGYAVAFTDAKGVVLTKNVATPTPTPSPTIPTTTKEQKILQIQGRIEIVKMNITSDKMVVWNDEHYPNNLSESEKQGNKDRLAKDEKELADLQAQLDTLLAQP
jgi:hypothetical protein